MTSHSKHRVLMLGLMASASMIGLGWSGAASAEVAPGPAAVSDKYAVEAVVVTANRRDQDLQAVGGALQVLTGMSSTRLVL